VFLYGVDTSASDSGYPELDVDTESPNDEPDGPKLEKWILNAIDERVRKNNVLIAGRMVRRGCQKA
jgi:hypothetical protein